MLRKQLLEVSARMAGVMLCNRLRRSYHNDLAALIAAIRTEINDPVGTRGLQRNDDISIYFEAWIGESRAGSKTK